MKVSEYFDRYGSTRDVEIFRGEDLPAGLPSRPGIYAWFAHIRFSEPDRLKGASVEGLNDILREQVFGRLQRPPYQIELKAALEPLYSGQIQHCTPSVRIEKPGHPLDLIEWISLFLSGPFAPLFSPPLYIGKAASQTIDQRIRQHLDLLRDYSGKNMEYLNMKRRQLVEASSPELGEEEEERSGHTFALDAAARRIREERLVLITYSPRNILPQEISVLESLLNRILFPLCGRR